jgi:Zn-dependent M28 family amino/carboxypeptidase
MRELVDALCSDRCAGRAAGSAGGREARKIVIDAFRDAGLDPIEQAVPRCNGANVIATIGGELDRYVLVAAHYDHLGTIDGSIYRGADDNAASVAIAVDAAKRLAKTRAKGRGVIFAAFDAEEPPHFMTGSMGSEHFARHPTVPLDRIDMMVCLEIVGHSLGSRELPAEVRESLFVLGAERSTGTAASVAAIERATDGLVIRRTDAEIIPPLSDYASFWERRKPFVLLTGGRSKVYHTPNDDPDALDFARMHAVSAWLERLVRDTCARHESPFVFSDQRDDVTTLETIRALLEALAPHSPQAVMGLEIAKDLRGRCRANGALDIPDRPALDMLVAGIESGLA